MYNHQISITKILGGLIFCCGLLAIAILLDMRTEYDWVQETHNWKITNWGWRNFMALGLGFFFFVISWLIISANNKARNVFVVFMHLSLISSIAWLFDRSIFNWESSIGEELAIGLLVIVPQIIIILLATHRLTKAECKGTEKDEFPDLLDY